MIFSDRIFNLEKAMGDFQSQLSEVRTSVEDIRYQLHDLQGKIKAEGKLSDGRFKVSHPADGQITLIQPDIPQQQLGKLSAKLEQALAVDQTTVSLRAKTKECQDLRDQLMAQVKESARLKTQLSAVSPTGWRSITERPPANKVVVVMRVGATYPFLAHTRPDGSWATLDPGESWREAKFDEYDSSYKWMDIPQ